MVISVHLPKTAGSTFRDTLAVVYGDDIFFDYGDQDQFVDGGRASLWARLVRFRRRIRFRKTLRPTDRCIHGHFMATKYLAQFPDATYITWMRDPVERVASHYYHWLRKPDPSTAHLLQGRTVPLETFAELEIVRNLQAKYLDGVPLSRFAFVGVQEYFEPMLERLWPILNLPPVPPQTRNTNRAKAVGERYEIAPAVRAYVAELNARDYELYNAVLARPEAQGLVVAQQTE